MRFLSVMIVAMGVAIPAVAEVVMLPKPVKSEQKSVQVSDVLVNYGNLVYANYSDALYATKALKVSIDQFVKSPSAENLKQARHAWLAARELYGQTEAFRFYGGPIDDKNGPEGRINAWPMDESFVDGVKDKPNSGLINNPKFVINKKNLAAQNERGGEENIATGWHAIEFLLWGQDLSETAPGDRSFEDYVDGKAKNADRRRLYLKTLTELLIDDLSLVAKQWAPNVKTNYRAKFEKGGLESVRKIFIGLGSLSRGELAGERMEVALASQNQEDEHSCFSDNTHRDVVMNAQGIQNVWLGEYTLKYGDPGEDYKRIGGREIKGVGLRDLVASKDPALADKVTQQIANTLTLAQKIQAPFDREIVGGKNAPGRLRIQATIDSLVAQSKDLVATANVVGITKLTLSEKKK